MRRKPKDRPVARPSLNKRERERLERISAEYVAEVEAAKLKRSAGKPSPSAEPRRQVEESRDSVTDEMIRRMPRSRRPTNGELKESDQLYRDLKEASDRATPAPTFPVQPTKPEEAIMAKKKTEEKPEVTARKGEKVRVVHRNTDGGWRLWEMETNKMIVHKLFSSERAAIQFATEHGLEPIKTGGGRKAEPEKKKASPAAATKKPATKKAPKTDAAPPTTADSNGSTPAAAEVEPVHQEVA